MHDIDLKIALGNTVNCYIINISTIKSEDNISTNNTGVSNPASENAHTASQVKCTRSGQNVNWKGLTTNGEFLLSDAGVNLSHCYTLKNTYQLELNL